MQKPIGVGGNPISIRNKGRKIPHVEKNNDRIIMVDNDRNCPAVGVIGNSSMIVPLLFLMIRD